MKAPKRKSRPRPRPVHKEVLAFIDPEVTVYSRETCYWRAARTEQERLMGLEFFAEDEPLDLPLTDEEQKERASLSGKKLLMFDIWVRMRWRSEQNQPPETSKEPTQSVTQLAKHRDYRLRAGGAGLFSQSRLVRSVLSRLL